MACMDREASRGKKKQGCLTETCESASSVGVVPCPVQREGENVEGQGNRKKKKAPNTTPKSGLAMRVYAGKERQRLPACKGRLSVKSKRLRARRRGRRHLYKQKLIA